MVNRKWSALSSSVKSLRASARTALVAVLVAATTVLALGMGPTAAHAADVATIADLEVALSPGTDATVTLTGDIWAADTALVIDRDVTLDLAGFVLLTETLTIAAGRTVTMTGATANRAVKMHVNGTLVLASDMVMINYSEVFVADTGRVVSDGSAKSFSGMYSIENKGTIVAQVGSAVRVTGHDYNLRFADNLESDDYRDIRVLAPTMQDAGVAIPVFSRTHATNIGWNSATDGTGTPFTTATTLTDVNWLNYAQWAPSGVTSIAVTFESPATAGETRLSAVDTSPGGGNADITDFVVFTSDDQADAFSGSGFYAVLLTELVGTRVITGTLRTDPTVTASVEISVVNSPYPDEDTIELSMTPTTVVIGGTSAAFLSARDGYGNDFTENLIGTGACPYCLIELTSSEPTDVVDEDTGIITFSTLGSRTIFARIWIGEGAQWSGTADVLVEAVPVTPVPPAPVPPAPVPPAPVPPTPDAPKELAATGLEAMPAMGAAFFLVALGMGALMFARRRSA